MSHLGISVYVASGINTEYRFLVIERYCQDLKNILIENNNLLKEDYVLYSTRKILYALQYIHSKGYAHADIKASNLMLKNNQRPTEMVKGTKEYAHDRGGHL